MQNIRNKNRKSKFNQNETSLDKCKKLKLKASMKKDENKNLKNINKYSILIK